MHHIAHVLLRDHGRLVLWEVVTISNECLVEVSTVLHDLGELIDRELDIGVSLHSVKYAQMKD